MTVPGHERARGGTERGCLLANTQLPSGGGRIELGAGPQGLLWGRGLLSGHGQAVIIHMTTVHSSNSRYSLHLARHVGQIEGVFGWENVVPTPGPGQGLMAPA